MSYIYIVEFDSGLIKVGKSCNPENRIISHTGNVKSTSGSVLSRKWISKPHANYDENEVNLIKFCSFKCDKDKSSGREWFFGCNFDDVLCYAESLNYDNNFSEKKRIFDEKADGFLDKIFGSREYIEAKNKLKIGYECSNRLQDFIQNSLWLNCDLFDINDQYKMSPFELIVGVHFASGDPIKMLVESISDLTIDNDLAPDRMFEIYDNAVMYVRSQNSRAVE